MTISAQSCESSGVTLCALADLIANSGVAVLHEGQQIALFYVPDESPCVFAVGNHDPIGGANVLSRGIIGDISGDLVVASPLYKQHFSLRTGICIEQSDVKIPVYPVDIVGDKIVLAATTF